LTGQKELPDITPGPADHEVTGVQVMDTTYKKLTSPLSYSNFDPVPAHYIPKINFIRPKSVNMSGSGTIPMKRFALVSGLLFLIVYLWVNTFHPDESGTDMLYPVIAGSSSPDALPFHDTITRNPHDLQFTASPPVCYYLIVGSFTDITQAQQIAEEYEDIFGTGILILPPTPEGYYRISCGTYLTGKEANAALDDVRKNHYPDAWILEAKN
jgi:hypothetical protein